MSGKTTSLRALFSAMKPGADVKSIETSTGRIFFEYKNEKQVIAISPIILAIRTAIKNAATHDTYVLITQDGLIYAKKKSDNYELVPWGKFYTRPDCSIGVGFGVLRRMPVEGEIAEIREKRNCRLRLILLPRHSMIRLRGFEDALVEVKGKKRGLIQSNLIRFEKEFLKEIEELDPQKKYIDEYGEVVKLFEESLHSHLFTS